MKLFNKITGHEPFFSHIPTLMYNPLQGPDLTRIRFKCCSRMWRRFEVLHVSFSSLVRSCFNWGQECSSRSFKRYSINLVQVIILWDSKTDFAITCPLNGSFWGWRMGIPCSNPDQRENEVFHFKTWSLSSEFSKREGERGEGINSVHFQNELSWISGSSWQAYPVPVTCVNSD